MDRRSVVKAFACLLGFLALPFKTKGEDVVERLPEPKGLLYMRVSNLVVLAESDITDWSVVETFDSLAEFDLYFEGNYNDRRSDLWKYKHVEILDESGRQFRYWFQHVWLPENDFFPIYPIPEKLVGLVPPKTQRVKDFILPNA